jgi:arylsulfatase A-like enzyme
MTGNKDFRWHAWLRSGSGLTFIFFAGLLIFSCTSETNVAERPNIILIMADDMGFSDIGCYGGEVHTPHLDRLAGNGLRLTQFYNGARCCPTRASLLTGLAPHQAGMGWMTIRDLGHPGYAGELNNSCVTLAEVLKDAGYATYMSGKWHLTWDTDAHQEGDKDSWPLQRGFDRFFGTILGAGNFYTPVSLASDNEIIEPGTGFFYTDAIVDHAIQFLGDHLSQKSDPFFLYMAFTAPHWPLHARDSTIGKYMDQYRMGWDAIREQRFENMKQMGLIKPGWELTQRDPEAPAWDELDEEKQYDMTRRMAAYAAQIDEMDSNIGRLVSFLKENRSLQNTVILFLADNGGCAEFISSGSDTSTEAIGQPESFESYRLPWANASNTPFRLYKHWTHEGGISTPLIIHWPEGITDSGTLIDAPAQINDIMPTLVDIGNGSYPLQRDGHDIHPIEGKSLYPLLRGESMEERTLFWEHEANRAARRGEWKLVSQAGFEYPFIRDWELYNMSSDRTETKDLASEYPEIVKELSGLWEQWATTHRVYPLDGREWGERLEDPVIYDETGNLIEHEKP